MCLQVDNVLWNEILARCPFVGAAMVKVSNNAAGATEDPTWNVEFIDEQAPPRQSSQTDPQELKPGELKQIYEQQVREHQSQLEHAEALALEKTMDFLQSDPEYLASMVSTKKNEAATKVPTTSTLNVRSGTKHHRPLSHADKSAGPAVRPTTLASA